MTVSPQTISRPGSSLGDLLRHWRGMRGKSQLDLALDTGISQKHVSFVETGRSRPSRQMMIDLSDALDIPLRDRNGIMLAAGYAPLYAEPEAERLSPEIDWAVQRLLRHQEPFPAIVLDRHWNVTGSNEAAPRFFGKFVDLGNWPRPRNLLRLVFDPKGLRPFLVDFDQAARALLSRVRREAVGGVVDAASRKLLDELAAYPGLSAPRTEALPSQKDADMPVIPLKFRTDDKVISMFSLVTTVGTPQSIMTEEMRLECMFPADDAAQSAYLDFMGIPQVTLP